MSDIYGSFEVKDNDGMPIFVSYNSRYTELLIGNGNYGAFISHTPIASERGIKRAVFSVIRKAGNNLTYNGSDKIVSKALAAHIAERVSKNFTITPS